VESIDIFRHPDNFLNRLFLSIMVNDWHGVEGYDRKRNVDGRLHRDVEVLRILIGTDGCDQFGRGKEMATLRGVRVYCVVLFETRERGIRAFSPLERLYVVFQFYVVFGFL
jgi:hypothetical protein